MMQTEVMAWWLALASIGKKAFTFKVTHRKTRFLTLSLSFSLFPFPLWKHTAVEHWTNKQLMNKTVHFLSTEKLRVTVVKHEMRRTGGKNDKNEGQSGDDDDGHEEEDDVDAKHWNSHLTVTRFCPSERRRRRLS